MRSTINLYTMEILLLYENSSNEFMSVQDGTFSIFLKTLNSLEILTLLYMFRYSLICVIYQLV